MYQEFDSLPPSEPAAPLSWSETWIAALTRPSVETYQQLINDPGATGQRAYTWVFVSTLLGGAIAFATSMALTTILSGLASSEYGSPLTDLAASGAVGLCFVPVGAILAVIGLAIGAGIIQWIAGMLGGSGTYSKLVYAFAAFIAPLSLVSFVVSAIPFANLCLGIPLAIYQIVLEGIAVEAVNRFGWGKAAASVLIPLAVIVTFCVCVLMGSLVLLGGAVENVFSDIISGLEAPPGY